MRSVFRYVFVLMLWASALCCVEGQVPESEARILGRQQTSGYSMELSQPYKLARRQWWQFLKTLGRVKLRKNYWELHFKEGIVLYAAIDATEGGRRSRLYVGLSSGVPEKEAEEYETELRKLLLSFGVSLEKSELQKRLQDYERRLSKKSLQLEKLRLRAEKLQARGSASVSTTTKMQELQGEVDALRKQQAEVIDRLSVLGD